MAGRTRGRAWSALSLSWLLVSPRAAAQVTATCQLNAAENRVYDLVPLEGALKSTEEMLDPSLPFRQYLPRGHDPGKKWPVIVFLHGIGEVGGTLRKVTEHSLPRVVESPEWDWPFIVLSPVLPTPSWHPRAQLVEDIFDYAVTSLGGDPNRLYLTGVSHGGAGTMAIGIELADKLAALWPVTPGGDADNFNWDRRAAIAKTPTMFLIGTLDGEYQSTQGWATELEGSGAPMFFEQPMLKSDEHSDTIPAAILGQSHVFVSYRDLPHDIWHAAYGSYCDLLTSYKTVQYEWLLAQSRDGSAFTDPREPGVPTGGTGGAGGAAGTSAGRDSGGGLGGSGGAAGQSAGASGSSTASPLAGGGGTGNVAGAPARVSPRGSGGGCTIAGEERPSGAYTLSLLGLMLWLRRLRGADRARR